MGRVSRAAFALFQICVAQIALAAECPTPGSVRLMLHEPDVLAGRLTHLGKAPETPAGRVAALRELFEAAACPQLALQGEGDRRSLECLVRGASDDVIVVGANQFYDSLGSVALLPSLVEALAAAPRKHTFRFVAFSAHESVGDRVNRVQKPKGAMRLIDALSASERSRVRAMIHIGPMGYGALSSHPGQAEDGLACAFQQAARAARLEIAAESSLSSDCLKGGSSPQGAGNAFFQCRPGTDWTGGKEWEPFRRVGIPVFGIHSSAATGFSGNIDPALYVKSYRALAIFLALADDALAAAPASPGTNEAPESAAATSTR